MVSAIGATAASAVGSSNAAQIAALEKQLAQYEKQLKQDEAASASAANSEVTQLLAAQIAAVQAQIAQLSNTSSMSATAKQSAANSATTTGGSTGAVSNGSQSTAAAADPQHDQAGTAKSRNSLLGNAVDVTI